MVTFQECDDFEVYKISGVSVSTVYLLQLTYFVTDVEIVLKGVTCKVLWRNIPKSFSV
jgi:hypothetical protein